MSYLKCNSNTVVIDPWGGSGTTGAVASQNGVPSICLDINPVMATFSAAKSRVILNYQEEIQQFFKEDNLERFHLAEMQDDPLQNVFHADTATTIRTITEAIPVAAHFDKIIDEEQEKIARELGLKDISIVINPIYAFYMSVIFVTLRECSGVSTTTNPTWTKSTYQKINPPKKSLFNQLERNCERMLKDLRFFFRTPESTAPNFSVAADIRSLPLNTESIDRIITSPPYLTRIDYAMSTTPELYLFGNNDLRTYIRHRTTGSPVITEREKLQKKEWGNLCNKVLNTISNHPTKAAKSYYWKNITQYFDDIDNALNELHRVLKTYGTGLIVVQSSYFKEIEIPLGEIYVEIALAKGFDARIAHREIVKGHMAHVNTRSSIYMKNKIYLEDIVLITKM